jgi:hypothetical protein
LSSPGDDPHRARITPPLVPMITYADFFVKIKNGPKSTFLELAAGRQPCARRYIACFVGKMRRFVYDAGGPRETVRNTIYTKLRDVTMADKNMLLYAPKNFSCIKGVPFIVRRKLGYESKCHLWVTSFEILTICNVFSFFLTE